MSRGCADNRKSSRPILHSSPQPSECVWLTRLLTHNATKTKQPSVALWTPSSPADPLRQDSTNHEIDAGHYAKFEIKKTNSIERAEIEYQSEKRLRIYLPLTE